MWRPEHHDLLELFPSPTWALGAGLGSAGIVSGKHSSLLAAMV